MEAASGLPHTAEELEERPHTAEEQEGRPHTAEALFKMSGTVGAPVVVLLPAEALAQTAAAKKPQTRGMAQNAARTDRSALQA